MKRSTLILAALLSTSLTAVAQDKKTYEVDFTDPKSVVNAVFYAAQTKDFAIMQILCDPYGQGDGDTKWLCSISQSAEQTDAQNASEDAKSKLSEFVEMFEPGRINGEVTGETYKGAQYVNVPFHFNHPNGESRSNESMKLVQRYGNWYLYSF